MDDCLEREKQEAEEKRGTEGGRDVGREKAGKKGGRKGRGEKGRGRRERGKEEHIGIQNLSHLLPGVWLLESHTQACSPTKEPQTVVSQFL